MAGRYFGENGGKNVYGGKKMMVNPYLHVAYCSRCKIIIIDSVSTCFNMFQYVSIIGCSSLQLQYL